MNADARLDIVSHGSLGTASGQNITAAAICLKLDAKKEQSHFL